MTINNKKWWVKWLSNGLRLSNSEEKILHICYATKKDHELLAYIVSTMNAMDEVNDGLKKIASFVNPDTMPATPTCEAKIAQALLDMLEKLK